MNYLLLSTEDAATIVAGFAMRRRPRAGTPLARVLERLRADTGGDFEEIVGLLKRLPICGACAAEWQEKHCASLVANKLGRRLRRLVDRAGADAGEEVSR